MNWKLIFLLPLLLVVCCRSSEGKYDISKESLEPTFTQKEINGVSLVNTNFKIDNSHLEPVKSLNANWITTMPFGFILRDGDSVQYNSPNQWIGERIEGVRDIIKLAHQKGLKVLVKPHMWNIGGSWIGDVEFSTEKEWQTFERSYMAYILDFAELAQSLNVEAFCIGVEMKKVVQQRPNYWTSLISKVREVYKGKLTYAANWDNYKNVTFWEQLDYIGIDAYFPTSKSKTPTVEECYNGWENSYNELKELSTRINKPVVFTEFGYRNIDYCALEPWNEDENSTNNTDAQVNAYKALFYRFWTEPWFKGGFLWKWYPTDEWIKADSNNRFTPQKKPVEAVIRDVYKKAS